MSKRVAKFKGKPYNCESCGKEFIRNSNNQIYCTSECRFFLKKADDYKAIAEWTQRHPVNTMLKTARERAKRKGVPFHLKTGDIELPTHCPVLGMELAFNRGCGHGGKDNSYSLDRIVPELGYIAGNIQILSSKANSMKFNATPKELVLFAEWVLKNYKGE